MATIVGFVVAARAGQRANPPSLLPPSSAPTTASTGPSGPLFPTQLVEKLVIPPAEIPSVTGLPATPDTASDQIRADATIEPDFVNPPCPRMLFPGSGSLFRGSGWISSRYQQSWGNPSAEQTRFAWRAAQFIAVYPGVAQAESLVNRVRGLWRMCANQTINATQDPPRADEPNPIFWSADSLRGSLREPTAIISLTQEGGGGWKMWRAVTAHNNVVFDLMIAARDAPESAIQAMLQTVKDRVDATR